MNSNSSVELTKIAKSMELKNLTPDVDISSIVVTTPDINRPALQLTGYFEHFASERVQIVGYVEFTYLEHMTRNQRVHAYEQFCAHKVPCIIFTSKTDPDEDILRIATENGIPVFTTEKNTSPFMAEIIRWLNVELAPCISIHGVLVDVYGEGVLIMGESGIVMGLAICAASMAFATPTDAAFWLVQKLNNLSFKDTWITHTFGNAIACIVMFAIVILLNMCRGFLPGL